ncbi:hypothetical protein BC941DRAFT_416139 [Chlamydoabsidia padenii]|nr:hypothetical protein BC941DRAFT_416139 [Chlamydoabsidia padenii]
MNPSTHGSHQPNQQPPPPPSSLLDSYESSENALMDSFKAAALKVTTLYKDSLVQNRKAYASGYQQALQDLYEFISSHPSTTVSLTNRQISTPTEHGFLPVEDLLSFARRRNDQLASEMGFSAPTLESTTTTATALPEERSHTLPEHKSTGSGVIGAAVKNAFHPFQIDPHTQFTFLPPSPTHCSYRQLWDNNNGMNRISDDVTQQDGLKRRITPSELSFMGRSLNSMNIDNTNWNEPAFKRRHKRDG